MPEPSAASTPALTPDYQNLWSRLDRFSGVDAEVRKRIKSWLLYWRQRVAEEGGVELPAPWIFATEENVVELEWHLPARKLIMTLHPEAKFDVYKMVVATGEDQEGETGLVEAADELLWVLKG